MTAISLQQIFGFEGLTDADPLVRMSAIHRAGQRYSRERSPAILANLESRLKDENSLVRRYAAVTLAQNDAISGVHWLWNQVVSSPERFADIEGCLRAYTRFPFLGLLAEHIDLRSIANIPNTGLRNFLEELIHMNEGEFLDHADNDPQWRDSVLRNLTSLDRIAGLDVTSNRMLLHGYVLSLPVENYPGFFFAPSTNGFFLHYAEATMSPTEIAAGKEALIIANPNDPNDEINMLFVLREPEELSSEELSAKVISMGAFTNAVSAGPLTPGLVMRRINSKIGLEVVDANGARRKENFRIKNMRPGQLALTPNESDHEHNRTYFVPNVRASPVAVRRFLKHVADAHGLQQGTVVKATPKREGEEFGKARIQLHLPDNPHIDIRINRVKAKNRVLLEPCKQCEATGIVPCDQCDDGRTLCAGKHKCGVCRGSGKTRKGRECTLCLAPKRVNGCNGTGQTECVRCNGAGHLNKPCDNCKNRPGKSGVFDPAPICDACDPANTGKCKRCYKPGSGMCHRCHGRGQIGGSDCRLCKGTSKCRGCLGKGTCTKCSGKGALAAILCQVCEATGKATCKPCRRSGKRKCAVCFDRKTLKCKRCRGSNNLHCSECQSGHNIRAIVDHSIFE